MSERGRLMRKLMWFTIGYCCALTAAHYFLPYEYLLPLAAVLAGLSLPALLLRGRAKYIAILLLLSASIGMLWSREHEAVFIRPAEELIGRTYEVSARVLEYPQNGDAYTSVEVRLTEEWTPKTKIRLYDYSGTLGDLIPGDEIRAELKFLTARTMAGTESDYYLSDGIFLRAQLNGECELTGKWSFSFLYAPKYLASILKEQIMLLFPDDVAPLMKALLTGDKTEFYEDDSLYTAMKIAGFSHIIAVSGMHVSFIVTMLRLMLGKRRSGCLPALILVWFFAAMTGFSPSVTRASVMMSLMLLAPVLGRENDPPTSLSAAALAITVINPQSIGSISFQLSFAALLGLITVTPMIEEQIRRSTKDMKGALSPAVRTLGSTLSASVGAIVFTTPLTALHFGFISLYSILTNLLCLWAMSAAFMAAYPICLISFLAFPVGQLLAGVLAWLPKYTIVIVKFIAGLPFAALSTYNNFVAWWLAAVYIIIFPPWLIKRKRFRPVIPVCICIIGLLAVSVIISLHPDRDLEINALDVGQGQCIVLYDDDTTVVIDCGSKGNSENAGDTAADHLLAHGRSNVDLLILTHLHEDHANGVIRLMNRVNVLRLVMPEDHEDTEYRDNILQLCYDKGTELFIIENDSQINTGDLEFDVYAPIGNDSTNEKGLIILGNADDYRFLITGDAGENTERLFISFYDIGDIDLLVVGHHGSQHSTCEELLDTTTPEKALISVGLNNYGHPTQEVLKRLYDRGIEVYRTDLNGNISVKAGNEYG